LTKRRRASLRSRLIKTAAYAILFVISGIGAFFLFQLSSPQQHQVGNDVTPDLLLLTSQRSVNVYLTVKYLSHSYSFPAGTRVIQMQFYGGAPHSTLQYSVLLGSNGAETNPVGSLNQEFFSGTPGGNSGSDCISPQISGLVQTLYGKVRLDGQGAATVTSSGTLLNQHAYLEEGSNDVVGVIAINSPITELAAGGGADETCIFPEWPYLGGVLWYPPSGLTGEVLVGQITSGYDVTSSNPALTDLSTLSWQINGPTAISYTLTNDSAAHRQLVESFLAGVVSALAAALLVETAKNAIGKAAEPADEAAPSREQTPTPASGGVVERDKHPLLTGSLVLAAFWAGLKERRSSR
jgi:hypothetical protein